MENVLLILRAVEAGHNILLLVQFKTYLAFFIRVTIAARRTYLVDFLDIHMSQKNHLALVSSVKFSLNYDENVN